MFRVLFILAIFSIIPSLKKVYNRQGLNVFDITLLFSAIYFWAIPVKDFLVNHIRPEYTNHILTALAICLYMWLLCGLATIYSHKKQSPLYITDRLAEISTGQLKDSFQWFAFVYIVYMLFQITNYSALDDENFEGNNNFFYGTNANLIIRLIVVPFRDFFPVIFVILWTHKPKRAFYRKLRILNLLLIVVSLLLGNKGFMVFNSTFLALYIYSKKRNYISKQRLISYITIIIILLSVIFPLSQAFRYYKQYAVSNTFDHSFLTVATGFFKDGISDDLNERVESYEQRRSLNIYDATDFAASRTSYQGNGYMTWIIFKYIIPQRFRHDGNIMAELMFGGGDVGESILAWYVLDWGVVFGPLTAVIYYLFLYLLYYYFGVFFNRWIKSSVYPLVMYSIILKIAVLCEHNPCADIKALYNTYYLTIIFTGIVLYYFNQQRKIYHSI